MFLVGASKPVVTSVYPHVLPASSEAAGQAWQVNATVGIYAPAPLDDATVSVQGSWGGQGSESSLSVKLSSGFNTVTVTGLYADKVSLAPVALATCDTSTPICSHASCSACWQ